MILGMTRQNWGLLGYIPLLGSPSHKESHTSLLAMCHHEARERSDTKHRCPLVALRIRLFFIVALPRVPFEGLGLREAAASHCISTATLPCPMLSRPHKRFLNPKP